MQKIFRILRGGCYLNIKKNPFHHQTKKTVEKRHFLSCKNLLTACLLLLFYITGKAQNVEGVFFNDAVALSELLANVRDSQKVSLPQFVDIISYYSGKQLTKQKAIDIINGDPFLKKLFPENSLESYITSGGNTTSGQPSSHSFSAQQSALAGSNVTSIAEGLAKFLVERGKEEISTVFFSRLNDALAKYPAIKILFPATTDVLSEIQQYNYQALLQQLKDALSKDLIGMPASLLSVRNVDPSVFCNGDSGCAASVTKFQALFQDSQAYRAEIIIPLLLLEGILNGQSLPDIAGEIVTEPSLKNSANKAIGYIRQASVFLKAFSVNSDTQLFLNRAQLDQLFSSADLTDAFLGLMNLKFGADADLSSGSGAKVTSLLTSIEQRPARFRSMLKAFDPVNDAVATIQSFKENGSQPAISNYVSIVTSAFNGYSSLFNALANFQEVTAASGLTEVNKMLANLKLASTLAEDIRKSNFAGAANGLAAFMGQNSIFASNDTKTQIIAILSFASNMASATSAEEVTQALNTVALPPGSFSLKQKSVFSAMINGYIGYNYDINFGGEGLYAHGIYAPIGINLAFGIRGLGAINIFSSLIDVGAIAGYQLSDASNDKSQQNIKFESLISPSVQLYWDIPTLPIAIGGGVRATPKLFYSNQSAFTTVPSVTVYNLTALVDIPIFRLFSSPFKTK